MGIPQAKYSTDLSKPEVIERLQLEKRYRDDKQIPWAIITEKEISKEVVMNIQWLYPAESEKVAEGELHHQFLLFQTLFGKQPNDSIIKIAQQLDLAYNQEPGVIQPKNLKTVLQRLSSSSNNWLLTLNYSCRA